MTTLAFEGEDRAMVLYSLISKLHIVASWQDLPVYIQLADAIGRAVC